MFNLDLESQGQLLGGSDLYSKTPRMRRSVPGKEADEMNSVQTEELAMQRPRVLQRVSRSQPYPPCLVHSLPSHECSVNASGMKPKIGCVTLDKSLTLSELQLSSLAGGLLILTFQDYARI